MVRLLCRQCLFRCCLAVAWLLLGFYCLLLMPARAKLDIARQSVHSVVLDKQALAAALANAQPTLWSADAGLLQLKARILVASVDL